MVEDARALVRALLKVDKGRGQAFHPADLATPGKSSWAQTVPDGRALYTLTPRDPTIPFTQLRLGDRLDVLARGPTQVRMVARDVILSGALRKPSGRTGACGNASMRGPGRIQTPRVIDAAQVCLAAQSGPIEPRFAGHGPPHNKPPPRSR